MKKTIEIDIPEGYKILGYGPIEVDATADSITHNMRVLLEREYIKDFKFYIKNYFKGDNIDKNTSDMLGQTLSDKLLQGNYGMVPFNILIDLLKFICDDLNENWMDVVGLERDNYNVGYIFGTSKIREL